MQQDISPQAMSITLIRAGTVLFGTGCIPITGWTSPTYGDKIPALACIYEIDICYPLI
jgi:hypothetical protein